MKTTLLVGSALMLGLSALACSGNPGGPNTTGTAGTMGTAGTTGAGGGGGTTGAGGSSGTFMSVAPCTDESSYTTGTTTITFGAVADISYMPKCLKVSKGATVTFMGDFVTHPLIPSALRGTTTGNPITTTDTGASASFAFPNAGYYAYYCAVHGASDGATGMVGVVWVQ